MPAGTTNCPSCGARIDAAPGEKAYVYTCRFCGAKVPVASLTPAPDPRIEIARMAMEMRAQQAREGTAAATASVKAVGKSVGCIVLVSALLPVLIPIGIFVVPPLANLISAHYGSFPMDVGVNGSLEISGRDATTTDTMVTVGVNGKLTIRGCHLKGAQIVKASTNAVVTIIDSTLDATKGIVEGPSNVTVNIENSTLTSGEEIVDAQTNGKINVSKGSKLHSASIAFPLANNGELSIDQSEVDGALGGIEIKNNGKVKLQNGAVVKSDGPGIDLAANGHLTITSSRVESKTTAVHAGYGLEGTLRAATLIGPRAALDVGSGARVTVAQSTVQGPKKGSAIDER